MNSQALVFRFSALSLIVAVVLFLCAESSHAQVTLKCEFSTSDPDGDGFGWENGRSCRVDKIGRCLSVDSDPDGDGFGWENGRSCRISNAPPSCVNPASDPDGDGFGWENSRTCVIDAGIGLVEERYKLPYPACSSTRFDPTGSGYGWENSRTCTTRTYGDGGKSITDVVLVTGQSNALGAETVLQDSNSFNAQLDSPVRRVYAFTNSGWNIAGLRQIWDRNWYPRADIDHDPANNFAFHFGKNLVLNDPSRVVGIIMITAPGEQISHWDQNQAFHRTISSKVQKALAALPQKSRLDAVLWHQGETDYYDTAYYGSKLNRLIGYLRAESWVQNNALFICGETLNSPVNARLMALNSDADPRSGCASANGLKSVGDDLHFSADSMRTLGARYAKKYRDLSHNTR